VRKKIKKMVIISDIFAGLELPAGYWLSIYSIEISAMMGHMIKNMIILEECHR